MKHLLTLNPDAIYTTYKNTNKITFPDKSIYNKNKPLFIEHLLVLFAYITTYNNRDGLVSMSATLKHLPEVLKSPDGNFTKAQLIGFLRMMAYIPRSAFIASAIKKPRLGSLTPIFMYAHKLYNNIKYSEWDRKDIRMDVALGAFLYKALEFSLAYPLVIDIEPEVRQSLSRGEPYTAFKRGLKYTYQSEETTLEPGEFNEEIHYPGEWLHLNCQFWLAHVDIRDSSYMLLDVANFGRVPQARDEIVHEVQERASIWTA